MTARGRAAPRESRDASRFWSLVVGGCLGGVAIVSLSVWNDGPRSLGAPGPLARPHRELACATCHAAESSTNRETSATGAGPCVRCHGDQPSARPVHSALSARNQLSCTDCHGIHQQDRGVAFETDGTRSWFENGAEFQLGFAPAPVTSGVAFVPLVSARGCSACHDPNASSDPAAHCFAPATSGSAFALCFDEHRRPARASVRHAAERDAAVEAARAIALTRRERPASAWLRSAVVNAGGCVVLGLALATGFIAWARRRKPGAAGPTRVLPLVPPGERRLPRIDTTRCLGCHACVDACPYDVLELQRYVAVVVRPGDCCGAGPCLERCPNGSLTLSLAGARPDVPELHGTLESVARPGLFLAGDVTGGSLIRNALRQGTAVARAIAERVAAERTSVRGSRQALELLIVGAGPAGLAAALTAKTLGLSFELIEQASVAESIQRFSRHKLVLDTASAAEEALPLWIGDAPKEQLLKRWLRTVRSARLEIREGLRLVKLDAGPDGVFRAHAAGADGALRLVEARHVLLAVGARGTPRPLDVPIPEAALDRVHYDLSDARAFAGRRVVVVGLGDVAMESALALAEQQGCEVTVVHRGRGFHRGKQRNVEALALLSARGRVQLLFEARITRVTSGTVGVELRGAERSIPYDALFVHIGALPARALLEAAGICSRATGSVPRSDGSRSS